MKANITKTAIFHKIKFDLKDHWRSNKVTVRLCLMHIFKDNFALFSSVTSVLKSETEMSKNNFFLLTYIQYTFYKLSSLYSNNFENCTSKFAHLILLAPPIIKSKKEKNDLIKRKSQNDKKCKYNSKCIIYIILSIYKSINLTIYQSNHLSIYNQSI